MSTETTPPKPRKQYKKFPTGPFKCDHPGCTRSFLSPDGLRVHKARIHSGKKWSSTGGRKRNGPKGKYLPVTAKRKPAPIGAGAPDKEQVQCDLCDVPPFRSAFALSIHKSRMHGVRGVYYAKRQKQKKKTRAPYGSLAVARREAQALALSTTHPAPATIPVRVQRVNHAPIQQAPIYHCPECGTFLPPHVVHNFCGTCGFGLAVLRQAIDLVANSGINRR